MDDIIIFVNNLFDYAIDASPMTLQEAKRNLEIFRSEDWCLPEGITAEIYMELWNDLCE